MKKACDICERSTVLRDPLDWSRPLCDDDGGAPIPPARAPSRLTCPACELSDRWGHAGRCFDCLRRADLLVDASGEPVREPRPGQRVYAARYLYRGVSCGKDCGGCPHSYQVYRRWHVGGRPRDRYLGPAAAAGDAYTRPKLRARRPAFGHRRKRL